MISNPNYDAQKDEIELLKNILFDQLNIVEEVPNFDLEISIAPDVDEDPKIELQLKMSLPDDYPDTAPEFEVLEESHHLASVKIKSLTEKIKAFIEDNLGMPMVYQIYEMVKDFANEQEENLNHEFMSQLTLEEENKKKMAEKLSGLDNLIENRTFTPVSKDNFEDWFKKYYAEINKGKEKKKEEEKRLSGREYFMKMKMEKIENYGDLDEGEEDDVKVSNEDTSEKEEAMFFDAEAFEENIDDIDFDQEVDVDDI